MSEFLRAPKYIGLVLAAGVGASALTGCGEKSADTWEVGVVCNENSEVQVASLDNEPYVYSNNDARIATVCVDEAGKQTNVLGLELTKGQGAIINTNKSYTNTVEIKYEDQTDGHDPEISFDTLTGYIIADNVKVDSVAVLE